MNDARFLQVISGQDKSLEARCMRVAFSGLACGYGAAMRLRNRLFDMGLRRTQQLPVPVISIGNLTTGGTGKTPLVACTVKALIEQGRRVGIVSRGYRSLDESGNDEKRVLALSCPQVPHIQDRDRVAASRRLIAEHQVDVIVADDAFQHRRLGRTLDVVLIDALQPWGFGHLLPRGLLREPCDGLRRASLVIVTRADAVTSDELVSIWQLIRRWKPDAAEINVAFRPRGFRNLQGETTHQLTGKALGFCGIGNPESFRKTLSTLPVEIVEFVTFPDHHHYSRADVERLHQAAQRSGAEALLTTVKDLVKWQSSEPSSCSVWAVDIEAEFLTGRSEFEAALKRGP